MTSPDLLVAHFMSAHSHRSWTVDELMLAVADNEFLKGLIIVLFWWAWTSRAPGRERRRKVLLATLPAPFIAFFVGRLLSHLLPYRTRPIADPSLHWHLAEGATSTLWARTWSSMPSDHAACFAAIAFALFLASWRVGVLAIFYAFFLIDLPRIYLGLHYLSDVFVGSLIGVAVTAALAARPIRVVTVPPMLHLKRTQPSLFYSCLFVCLYSVGCINSVHALFQLTSDSFKAWSHHSATSSLSGRRAMGATHLSAVLPTQPLHPAAIRPAGLP